MTQAANEPFPGQRFFHATGSKLQPGDRMQTFYERNSEDNEDGLYVGDHAWRAQRVWMSDDAKNAKLWAGPKAYVYEIYPSSDVTLNEEHYDMDPEGQRQFHASSATVVRRVDVLR